MIKACLKLQQKVGVYGKEKLMENILITMVKEYIKLDR
jgi:hypothetical protein